VVETEGMILAELELLAPAGEVPASDWQQVRRRLEPLRPSLGQRRVRLAVGVAAIILVGVAAASAAYLASRASSPKPVTNKRDGSIRGADTSSIVVGPARGGRRLEA
jgi:hypothetical protein